MMTINIYNKHAIKMMKNRNAADHKKFHIKRAAEIRETADHALEISMNHAAKDFGGHHMIPESVHEEIMIGYNNLLAEAIAEENSKCMDKEH